MKEFIDAPPEPTYTRTHSHPIRVALVAIGVVAAINATTYVAVWGLAVVNSQYSVAINIQPQLVTFDRLLELQAKRICSYGTNKVFRTSYG